MDDVIFMNTTNATLNVPEIEHTQPIALRFIQRDGQKILQMAVGWTKGLQSGYRWKDVPLVDIED